MFIDKHPGMVRNDQDSAHATPGRTPVYAAHARPLTTGMVLFALIGTLLGAAAQPAFAAWAKPAAPLVEVVPTTATLSWKAVPEAPGYRVKYSTSSSWSKPKYVLTTSPRAKLSGLKAATTYYAKVRVARKDGTNLGPYSATTKFTTPKKSSLTALKPTGLVIGSRANTSLQLSWKAVTGATSYQVKYATSSKWKGAKYATVTTATAELTKLASGRTHYVKVRVITPGGLARSNFSARVKAATRAATGFPYLRPGTPTATKAAATSIAVSWPSRGSGLSYRVRYDTDADYGSPAYAVVKGTKATLSGLLPNTGYSVSVRVVDATNSPTLSEYSPSLRVATTTMKAPLRVATYNVKAHNSFKGQAGETTWSERRTAVAALIKKQAPDVIGLQEAQQSRLYDADGKLTKVAQMEDLVNLLGAPYELANPYRYDCVKSTTKTNCVAKDRETSRGVRIVYNSAELKLIRHGAKRLSYVKAGDMERYVAWAVFRHKDSGKDFMFADVHFENTIDSDGSTSYYELRKTQTRESLAEVDAYNPDRLPVIVVGDLNSTKTRAPDNAPYDLMRAAGYVDPLGNTYKSTTIAEWATAEKRINANYNSFNKWQLNPPRSSNPNGTYYDYIFTSGAFRVSEWETAMTLNADGTYKGVIPSDHHLLRASVWLP